MIKPSNIKKVSLVLVLLCSFLVTSSRTSATAPPPHNEYLLPENSIDWRFGLTPKSDGTVWFIKYNNKKVVKVNPDGQMAEYDLPLNNPGYEPYPGVGLISEGPDGNMWFVTAEFNESNVPNPYSYLNKITDSGVVTSYPIDISSTSNSQSDYANIPGKPLSVAPGPDGNMWIAAGYTQQAGFSIILKVSTSGNIIDEWEVPGQRGAWGIIPGPDGNMWFSAYGKVSKITDSGQITAYDSFTTVPPLAKAPDGSLWYTGATDSSNGWGIYSLSSVGESTKYYSFEADMYPESMGIAFDNSGNILFSSCVFSEEVDDIATKVNCGISQIDTSGNLLNYYPFPENMYISNLTRATNGSIWAVAGTLDLDSEMGVSALRLINFSLDDLYPGEPPTPPTSSGQTPSAPRTGNVAIAALTVASILGLVFIVVLSHRHIHKPASER